MKYHPTPLEKWITNFYRNIGFVSPDDIDEEIITFHLNIFLFIKPLKSNSYESGNFKSITLDGRLNSELQREVFFHELAHILRHSGWQLGIMPEAFRQLQEWDANRFIGYAAIPFHMLRHIDLRQEYIIPYLAETFKVTPQICELRLMKIYEQAKAGSYK
ncbi:ImmA/IrrE family metallo-endopeptidase [Salipaludibacillus sp. CF4.18]|uniref:ImmA/IrrE family metallo-endopeptidase n=1 Tax=Salipaludibacillus sp. CF4.18 TaxID=3373081 RepID=UPI003EE4ACAB